MSCGEFAAAADAMIRQLQRYGIEDKRVLDAMRSVPRHAFVPEAHRHRAYDDRPLPIGAGQTISQPYIVARMAVLAQIVPGNTVLDVGTGSGYGAAVLSRLAAKVVSVERHASLADSAGERLRQLGFDNVDVHTSDGTQGWIADAPYSAIVAAAASRDVPVSLCEQLALGGKLVIPVGGTAHQTLQVIEKKENGELATHKFEPVAFVPLIGDQRS